jgi:hypothetical protein
MKLVRVNGWISIEPSHFCTTTCFDRAVRYVQYPFYTRLNGALYKRTRKTYYRHTVSHTDEITLTKYEFRLRSLRLIF